MRRAVNCRAFGERRNFCNVHSCPGCEWLQGPLEITSPMRSSVFPRLTGAACAPPSNALGTGEAIASGFVLDDKAGHTMGHAVEGTFG